MLVLARKKGQRILAFRKGGDRIEIQVMEITGGRVRLGITAPSEVTILREEVEPREPQAGAEA